MVEIMDKAGAQAAFIEAGLTRLLKDFDELARASIRLYTTPTDEAMITMGSSKFGGHPDLPHGITWPEWKRTPQSFVAQIRLEDAQAYDLDHLLPSSGMLWFFYDALQETFGEDPHDRGGWSVFYRESGLEHLRRTPAPTTLPASSQFKPCSVNFASEVTLPQQPQLELVHFDWTTEEQKRYEKLLSEYPSPADHAMRHNRLLGHPDTIQDDMHVQCQLLSHGVSSINDPRTAGLLKGAKDWQLLLQVDTDEDIGMRWGNAGMLYYWIEMSHLHARRFDTTWLVLQSE